MRTIVDLPPQHVQQLDRFSAQARISRAELIRRAVADYLQRHPLMDSAIPAFGLWANRKEDGLAYQERIRAEWDDV